MDYETARRHMVESQVRPNDVTDIRIQRAMETIPREMFVPPELRDQVYVEREIEYAPGRRLLRARDFAKLVSAADIRASDVILNVAAGSGYSTSILACLAEMVVSVESDESLAALAQDNLNTLNFSNAAVISGAPEAGAAGQGPFDVIFVGGVIEREPTSLLGQLKDGGRLAALVRENGVTRGGVYLKSGQTSSFLPRFDAAASTVLAGFERAPAFQF